MPQASSYQPASAGPTSSAADGMQDDPSDSGQGGDDQGDGGFCVEIRVKADGSISVGVEPMQEEQSEEEGGAGGDDDSEYTPVKSTKEALTLALEIIRGNGVMPGQADDDFQAGFEGANK